MEGSKPLQQSALPPELHPVPEWQCYDQEVVVVMVLFVLLLFYAMAPVFQLYLSTNEEEKGRAYTSTDSRDF